VIAGLLLALASALAGSVSLLLKQRGADGARALSGAQRGWPVSLQVVDGRMARRARCMAAARRRAVAGLAIERASRDLRAPGVPGHHRRALLGFRLGRRQWTGVLVTAIGLGVLGLTTAPVVRQHASAAALIAVEGAVLALSGS
jgi:hypothetical protein